MLLYNKFSIRNSESLKPRSLCWRYKHFMEVNMTRSKLSAVSLALLCTAAAGFAQTTKVGKITAITLDTETNQTSVTVTLGELQLPLKDEKTGKLEIIALGSDTVTFAVDENLAIEPYNPFRGEQAQDADTEADDAEAAEADGAAPDDAAAENGRPRHRPNESRADRNKDRRPQAGAGLMQSKLALGRMVQLVYAEDGSTVQTVQLVPDAPQFPPQGAHGMAPAGRNLPPQNRRTR